MKKLLKWFFAIVGRTPADMEMVQYWKTKTEASAKVTKAKDGTTLMYIEGEKYPQVSYPRGYLLYGKLSKLKHEIKNQIFNESWAMLEAGKSEHDVMEHIYSRLPAIYEIAEGLKYDMPPVKTLAPAVRELHRAWSQHSQDQLRDIVCLILQEDDSYRFRVQWMAPYFMGFFKKTAISALEEAFTAIEHAEVIDDMKERERLWKRILMVVARQNPTFIKILDSINWKKMQLTKGDKYHFRGKYFKVDTDLFDY